MPLDALGATTYGVRMSITRSGRRLIVAIGITVPLSAVSAWLMVTAASAAPGSGSPVPKADLPANVNPAKTPILDPSKIKKEPMVAMPADQTRQQVLAWLAQDPHSRVACFNPDGSVAGVVELDKVDPSTPITATQAAEACGHIPGTHAQVAP